MAREAVHAYTGHRYTQHSTGVADGAEGFLAFFEPFVERNPKRDMALVAVAGLALLMRRQSSDDASPADGPPPADEAAADEADTITAVDRVPTKAYRGRLRLGFAQHQGDLDTGSYRLESRTVHHQNVGHGIFQL